MESCTIFLEPLLLSLHTTADTKCPLELVKNNNVTLLIERNYLSNILKPKQSDYAMFKYGNPCSAFHRVQWPLKDFICCLSSPEHRVHAVDIAW